MFRFALGNLFSRPVRSALSTLGLTVAIAGMVGLFSIAGGIDHLVHATFNKVPGLLVQQRGAPIPLFSTLPVSWQDELAQIEGVTVVNPEVMARVNLIGTKTILNPPRFLLGTDIPSRLTLKKGIFNEHLVAGRYLVPGDKSTKNCVVSRQICEEFHKKLGDFIRVNGIDLTIVGVYHTGSILLDVNLLLDLDSVRAMGRFDRNSVCCYYLEHDGKSSNKTVSRRIEAHFQGRNLAVWKPGLDDAQRLGFGAEISTIPGLKWLQLLLQAFRSFGQFWMGPGPAGTARQSVSAPPTEEVAKEQSEETGRKGSAVEVRSAEDWAERFQDFSGDLNLFLILMTTIGVVIAVLSIVNTMLMSVTERTVEFGILRANGWSRRDILRLITVESGLLGITGGSLGVLIGWIVVQVLNWKFPSRLHLYAGWQLLCFSLLFSTTLGVVGGLYPAWLAARMSPMKAIRRA